MTGGTTASLDANLKCLEEHLDFIGSESRARNLTLTENRLRMGHFYQLLAYELAETVAPSTFRICAGIARQQMRGK
jgi:hypothetical protein